MCLSVNENERLSNCEACLHAVFFFFNISNVMRKTHTPPRKPLNYVLNDLPPSPAACPILGQQHFRARGTEGRKKKEA